MLLMYNLLPLGRKWKQLLQFHCDAHIYELKAKQDSKVVALFPCFQPTEGGEEGQANSSHLSLTIHQVHC